MKTVIGEKGRTRTASKRAKAGDKKSQRIGEQKFGLIIKPNRSLNQLLNHQSNEIAYLKSRLSSLEPTPKLSMKTTINGTSVSVPILNSSPTSQWKKNCFSFINHQLQHQLEYLKQQFRTQNAAPNYEQYSYGQMHQMNDYMELDGKNLRQDNYNAIRHIQNQLNLLHQKFFESRNQNCELKSQLKLAVKCLQQEIGENFTLNTLASQSSISNWRGRAQEIVYLQQKLSVLKKQLKRYEQQSQKMAANKYKQPPEITEQVPARQHQTETQSSTPKPVEEKPTNPQRKTSSEDANVSPRSKQPLRKKDSNSKQSQNSNLIRIEKCERLKGGGNPPNDHNGELHITHNGHQLIAEMFKARAAQQAKTQTLEREIAALKLKLEERTNRMILLKKHNILLKQKLIQQHLKHGENESQIRQKLSNESLLQKINSKKVTIFSAQQLQIELVRAHQRYNDLKQQFDEKVNKVQELNGNIVSLNGQLAEKEESIGKLNQRVERLESDLKAVSGDFLFSCRELRKEEFIGVLNSLESEKKDLLEYNKTLNGRIKKERQENEALSKALADQKIRSIQLESRLNELTQCMNGNSVCENEPNSKGKKCLEHHFNRTVQELETLRENITVLEHRIRHLNDEKENDVKGFEQVIENSKAILLDTIFTLRAMNCANPDAK